MVSSKDSVSCSDVKAFLSQGGLTATDYRELQELVATGLTVSQAGECQEICRSQCEELWRAGILPHVVSTLQVALQDLRDSGTDGNRSTAKAIAIGEAPKFLLQSFIQIHDAYRNTNTNKNVDEMKTIGKLNSKLLSALMSHFENEVDILSGQAQLQNVLQEFFLERKRVVEALDDYVVQAITQALSAYPPLMQGLVDTFLNDMAQLDDGYISYGSESESESSSDVEFLSMQDVSPGSDSSPVKREVATDADSESKPGVKRKTRKVSKVD